MKTVWSKTWKRSIQPRKQRKYSYNSPLHIQRKSMISILSKELRATSGKRNTSLRKNDKVRVMRGQFRKKTGKVSRIDLKNLKVYIEGIEHVKKDGTKSQYPLNSSNLMIIELNLDDRKRKENLSKKTKKTEEKKIEKKKE